MIFDELSIDEEFTAFGRNWKKKSQFGAICLSKDSPHDPDATIAFDRKQRVELNATPAESIFKRRAK